MTVVVFLSLSVFLFDNNERVFAIRFFALGLFSFMTNYIVAPVGTLID